MRIDGNLLSENNLRTHFDLIIYLSFSSQTRHKLRSIHLAHAERYLPIESATQIQLGDNEKKIRILCLRSKPKKLASRRETLELFGYNVRDRVAFERS